MMPSLRFVFGTEGEIDTQALKINYKPNWKCAITETWFHGQWARWNSIGLISSVGFAMSDGWLNWLTVQ